MAPTNSPALSGISLCPNMMDCWDSSEMVQKGRLKSWWSMCGGMQSICIAAGSNSALSHGPLPHAPSLSSGFTIWHASGQRQAAVLQGLL